MRYILRTDYAQDTRLFRDGLPQIGWYVLWLALALIAPQFLGLHSVSQLTFIAIFAIAGLGMQLLLGFCGLLSLGQAGFMAVGAYACLYCERLGLPFPAALLAGALVATVTGGVLGQPVLRLRGLYLAVATMSLGFIIEEVAARWSDVTGGNSGMIVDPIRVAGVNLSGDVAFYYLSLSLFVLCLWLSANVLRSPSGRAMFAVRDSEVAAQSMGIETARIKTLVFAISAGFSGVAGALMAHKLTYVSPDQFNLGLSIELLLLVLVGGVGSLRGVVFGAAFIVAMPELLAALETAMPGVNAPALRPMVFGLMLALVMIFEPHGINGLLTRALTWGRMMPLYRKGTFARQRSFSKSERW